MYKLYYFVSDGGDGSASVCWTDDPTLLERLEDADPQSFGCNEGSYSGIVLFETKEHAYLAGLAAEDFSDVLEEEEE